MSKAPDVLHNHTCTHSAESGALALFFKKVSTVASKYWHQLSMAENFGAVAVGQTTARAWADRNNPAVALSNDDQAAAPHLEDEEEFEESKTLLRHVRNG